MAKNIHFSGIAGAGMSAIAQMSAGGEFEITGSDREFDRGHKPEMRSALESLGIRIVPQDGSGVTENTARLVVSTAIEDSSPEIAAAKKHGVPVVHRSEVLAEFVNSADSIVISGTSGKSTVAGMTFCILEHAGLNPSVITGGALLQLQKKGLIGNAFKGKSNVLVVEGDESDGSLVRYFPKKGVALNITRDHKTIDELKQIFLNFRDNCLSKSGNFAWNAADPICHEIFQGGKGIPFSIEEGKYKIEKLELHPFSSSFYLSGVKFELPVPGAYNAENAAAACAGAAMYGVSLETAAEALRNFAGVERRFVLIGEKNGIKVIDDFAHNPAKLAAALSALKSAGRRVFAVYQPHGFTPTRNLRAELVRSLSERLGKDDLLLMPEIYYAGGTVNKTISSEDLVNDVKKAGKNAMFCPDRTAIPGIIAAKAAPGDIIGVMGARDATLTQLAKDILEKI
ncbi:MAG: hypothetical protein J5706_05485 [Elusimicrobiales bacterium]|nr:hypothetical protein [Elusimicrobiales bacterium]